jgi:hypothetical protein
MVHRIASGPFWPALRVMVIAGFFVSAVGIDVVTGFIAGFTRAPRTEFNSDPIWPVRLFWCIPLGLLFARWLLRGRWGGSRMLDASSGRSRLFGVLAITGGAYIHIKVSWLAATGGLPPNPAPGLFFLILDTLLWVFLWALSGRLEFRQHGILTAVGFYRWPNIESYEWCEAETGRMILQLKLRRRHPILPPVRIKVPAAKTAEVEAIMSRFLSEWPTISAPGFAVKPQEAGE